MESRRSPKRLPIKQSSVAVCEAECTGTNQKGRRGAETLDEDRERLRLC
jgi:hypothetical protein